MATIVSLPPEVIYHIGAYLDIPDNKVLRYVCRYISEAVEPLALSSVAFCLDKSVLFLYAKKLRAYATRTTKAAAHIRNLAVVAMNQLDDMDDLRTKWLAAVPIVPPEGNKQLLQVFCDLLLSLDNLTSFDWYLDNCIPERIIVKLLAFLSSVPVKELSIMYSRRSFISRSLLRLQRPFHAIRKLEYTEGVSSCFVPSNVGPSNLNPSRLVESREDTVQLMRLPHLLIANCPNIQQLSLKTSFYNMNAPVAARLQDFLPLGTTATGTPPALQLGHLSVTGLCLRLDHAMLHHLRALQYLHIRFPLTAPVYGHPVSTIMNTLRTEKIYMRGLDLDMFNVGNEVLEYLLSYASEDIIQEITFDRATVIKYSNANPDNVSGTAARFFAEVLPAVAGSLVSLHVTTTDPLDLWRFDPTYVDSIKLCRKLENLRLFISAEADNKVEVGSVKVSLAVDEAEQCESQEALEGTRQYLPRLLSFEIHRIPTGMVPNLRTIWL